MFVTVVVAAGGKGVRMGISEKKQYVKLGGKPVLSYSLEVFAAMEEVKRIVLVIPEGDGNWVEKYILEEIGNKDKISIVHGGAERQASVWKGVLAAEDRTEILLVHDGARPFVTEEIARECIMKAEAYGACTAAVPVKETIKYSLDGLHVKNTLERQRLYNVQTPQAFRFELIRRAHEKAAAYGFSGTDDAVLVEAMGEEVVLSKGSYENIKITSLEDIVFAEALVRHRKESES